MNQPQIPCGFGQLDINQRGGVPGLNERITVSIMENGFGYSI